MRIQCNSCESAAATVLCIADEAALCSVCDEKVHAANKLAGKHQRVRLVAGEGAGSAGRVPKCDICQESSGYFFCLEDRALLCRNCDVAVHSVNAHVAAHQRFLLTGVQVGGEPSETVGPAAIQQANAALNPKPFKIEPLPKSNPPLPRVSTALHRSSPSSLATENSTLLPNQIVRDGGLVADRLPFSGFNFSSSMPDWPLDEFFKYPDFSQNLGFMDQGSSKADSGKHGSSEGSLFNHSTNEELDVDECSDPNFSGMVPEIPSPPTFSGLHWQKNQHYPSSDNAAHVPDVCSSQDPYTRPSKSSRSKRSKLL